MTGGLSRSLLPAYGFSQPLALTVMERYRVSIGVVAAAHARTSYGEFWDTPPLPPDGASEQEVSQLEQSLGMALPDEYRAFLLYRRYLEVSQGCSIWGIGHEREQPWVSTCHPTPNPCLVIGDYWRFADGDQLLLTLDRASASVLLYLHEHGPRVEEYAPSFSLAVWRLAHEAL